MNTFTKLVLIGVTALTAITASAQTDADRRARNVQEAIAAHRQAPVLTPVAARVHPHHVKHHPRHRHVRHHAHPVHHVR